MRIVFYSTFFALVLLFTQYADRVVDAQVMQSASYQIESDSINIGGGFSTSTTYQLQSTVGEIATGRGTSTSYNLFAGYQQMQTAFLSLSSPSNVMMTPDIAGLTGGESNGSTTITATSDSASGYQLTIKAESSPAMVNGAFTLADYVPAGPNLDTTFTTDTSEAHFGFSVSGLDIVDAFKSNAGVCGSGTDTVLECWDGLSTIDKTISSRTSANQPSGTDTTIYFKVGIGPSSGVNPGLYVATTTITLLSL